MELEEYSDSIDKGLKIIDKCTNDSSSIKKELGKSFTQEEKKYKLAIKGAKEKQKNSKEHNNKKAYKDQMVIINKNRARAKRLHKRYLKECNKGIFALKPFIDMLFKISILLFASMTAFNGNAYDIGYNGVMCATILFWIFQNYCNFENEYSKDKLKFNHILGIVGVVTCYIAIITFCIWHIISLTVVLLVLMVIISVAIEYTNYGWNRLKSNFTIIMDVLFSALQPMLFLMIYKFLNSVQIISVYSIENEKIIDSLDQAALIVFLVTTITYVIMPIFAPLGLYYEEANNEKKSNIDE